MTNDGIGRAGEEISGALKAGAWNGSGILGSGVEVRVVDETSAGMGGGDGDFSEVSSDDSSISSSTSIASRDGEGV